MLNRVGYFYWYNVYYPSIHYYIFRAAGTCWLILSNDFRIG